MQENSIAKAGQERLKQAIEGRTEKPEVLAREMLRQGDVQVTDILSWIDDQEQAATDSGDIALMEELGDIKQAVNEAYAKLKTGLEQAKRTTETGSEDIDMGWDAAEVTPETQAAAESPEDETPTIDLAERVLETGEGLESLKKRIAEGKDIEDIAYAMTTMADKVLSADDAPLDRLARLASLGETDARLKAELKTALAENIFQELGGKLADRLLSSPEYVESLKGFKALADTRLGEHGPRILDQKNLLSLLSAKEIFGSPENLTRIVKAIDLSGYTDELKIDEAESVVQVLQLEVDKETGDFKTSANAKIKYNNDEAVINRNFTASEKTDESGGTTKEKSVTHAVFRLPENMKSKGLAAKMFAEALPEYEQAGIDKISLHANIDVGGYAWASYGFDWDEDETVLKKHCNGDESQFRGMGEAEKIVAFVEQIRRFTDECQQRLARVYGGLGLKEDASPLKEILGEFGELTKDPEAVTPQAIANFGKKNSLKIFRHPVMGYISAEKKTKSIEENRAKEEDFIGFHPGKVALFGQDCDWYGKMEGSSQISALRAKVSRPSKQT